MTDAIESKIDALIESRHHGDIQLARLEAAMVGYANVVAEQSKATTEAFRRHEDWLHEHEITLDGIEDKLGVRSRLAVLESTIQRQKWVSGLIATGLVMTAFRVIADWMARP